MRGNNYSRESWLRELRHLLRPHYSRAELEEVISDYEGFFREGEKNGESMAELCADFGTPESVAENLISDLPVEKRGQYGVKKQVGVWLPILLVAALAAFFIIDFEQNSYRYAGKAGVVWYFAGYAAVFPILCWFVLLRGNERDISGSDRAVRQRKVIFLLQIVWYVLFLAFSYLFLPYVIRNWKGSSAGPRLTGTFYLLACFAGALIVAAGLCMKQGNRAMIREVSLGFGQLSGIFWYLFSVANYSTPKDWDGTEEGVFRGFQVWMQGRNELCAWALFAVGILAAVLFTYRIRTGGKEGEQERGREAWMHK